MSYVPFIFIFCCSVNPPLSAVGSYYYWMLTLIIIFVACKSLPSPWWNSLPSILELSHKGSIFIFFFIVRVSRAKKTETQGWKTENAIFRAEKWVVYMLYTQVYTDIQDQNAKIQGEGEI